MPQMFPVPTFFFFLIIFFSLVLFMINLSLSFPPYLINKHKKFNKGFNKINKITW
uniref:ATP synthase F0 subunit 8 n=1 Tax=Ricinus sp. ADS-2020 TaxID=2794903 RepID=A0A7T1M830_9NEOP|nr:ATP synthase F0 subunit 8 [Ricinus sp. ADS-2020]